MKNKYRLLSISGSYWTGSSALIDLLQEHRDCLIVPEEFAVFSYGQFFKEVYAPISKNQTLNDEQFSNLLRMLKFNESEPRLVFSAARYVCRLLGIFPKGIFEKRMGMNRLLGKRYSKSCLELYKYLEHSKNNLSNTEIPTIKKLIKNVLIQAANYGRNVATEKPEGSELIVFDQLIAPPYTNYALPAIPDLRLLHVNRDWKDQYVDIRHRLGPMLKIHSHLGLKPYGETLRMQKLKPIDFFIELIKFTHEIRMDHINQRKENIMWIDFEDIVLETSRTASNVFDFLNLDPKFWSPNTVFRPEMSKNNIGQWKSTPWQDEIKYIEEKLQT